MVVDEPLVSAFLRLEVAPGISAAVGPRIVRAAQMRAPVRTGRLLDSIGYTTGEDAGGGFTQIHAIFYDIFQERPAKQIRHARRTLIDAMAEGTPGLL